MCSAVIYSAHNHLGSRIIHQRGWCSSEGDFTQTIKYILYVSVCSPGHDPHQKLIFSFWGEEMCHSSEVSRWTSGLKHTLYVCNTESGSSPTGCRMPCTSHLFSLKNNNIKVFWWMNQRLTQLLMERKLLFCLLVYTCVCVHSYKI